MLATTPRPPFWRCLFLIALTLPAAHGEETPASAGRSEANAQAVTPQDGPIRLFDGQSLDGLYTWLKDTGREDPRRVFRVTDGMLHITGDGWGSIITNSPYRDYHLVLEFKWGGKTWGDREDAARDSGLLVHSNGKEGGYGGIWMPSLEVQIIEGGVGDFILVNGPDESGEEVPLSITCHVERDRDGEVVWAPDGKQEVFDAANRHRINWSKRDVDWADTEGYRGRDDVESPLGEWTRMDVIADGGHVEVFVNGVKVNEAFEVSPRQGRIQLQSELAEMLVRRWELWPVGKGPRPAPATE